VRPSPGSSRRIPSRRWRDQRPAQAHPTGGGTRCSRFICASRRRGPANIRNRTTGRRPRDRRTRACSAPRSRPPAHHHSRSRRPSRGPRLGRQRVDRPVPASGGNHDAHGRTHRRRGADRAERPVAASWCGTNGGSSSTNTRSARPCRDRNAAASAKSSTGHPLVERRQRLAVRGLEPHGDFEPASDQRSRKRRQAVAVAPAQEGRDATRRSRDRSRPRRRRSAS
jgi:hypothetical protein